MISANYVDGLELRIKELTAERDNALAQNAELMAQVEAIKSAYQNLCGAIRDLDDCESGTDEMETAIGAVFHAMRNGYNSVYATPTQHLRDIQAKSGRAGFVAGYNSGYADRALNRSFSPEWHASNYSNRIRRGEA